MPPSFPHMSDEYEPTNQNLWGKVLEVARGDAEELTVGQRTIHKPDGYVWPSPPASAWAVKQYKGFGGAWKRRKSADIFRDQAMRILKAGGVVTSTTSEEHGWMEGLQKNEVAHRIHTGADHQLWELHERIVTAGLGNELTRRMNRILAGDWEKKDLADLAEWLGKNFRVNSARTPRGKKPLKESLQGLIKMLALAGHPSSTGGTAPGEPNPPWILSAWQRVQPQLDDLVAYFTTEGDAARGKKPVLTELKLSNATYLNRSSLSNTSFERYAQGVERVLASLKGWRSKALAGNLKVAFVGAKELKSQGKYKQAEDVLLIRATPKVLKRAQGYGTVDYIVVHELGHRYEKLRGTAGIDFDRPEWWTTQYSKTDSFGGSEAFAELFALGQFRLTGSWSPDILDRFESVMTGRSKE